MICVYELSAAERHTIREGLYELMGDFERPWRMLLHLWLRYWGEGRNYEEALRTDAEFVGDLLLTITNELGDALKAYHLTTGGELEGDRAPCAAFMEEAKRIEQSRRVDECFDAVRKMVCQARSLTPAERDAFLDRLNNEITTKRDNDAIPELEAFTAEVKNAIDRRME